MCVKDITKTNLKADFKMKRSVYEAPVTERFQVEMEGGFCSGSADVENPNQKDEGRIEKQAVNEDFGDFGDNFSSAGWE